MCYIEKENEVKFNPQVSSVEPEVEMISFSINGTEYQAEEGMTWEEWVNKYADNRFTVVNNCIYFYNNMYSAPIIDSSSQSVHINDIIQKDDIYYIGRGGGAD